MKSSIIPKEERSEEESPSKVDFTLILPTDSLCYKSGVMQHVPVLLLKLDSKCRSFPAQEVDWKKLPFELLPFSRESLAKQSTHDPDFWQQAAL